MSNTEKYIGESPVIERPTKKVVFILKDGAVTSSKIAPSSVSYSHLSREIQDILNGYTLEEGGYNPPVDGIPKTDLAEDVQASLDKADTALQSFTEVDPTVPSWAKSATKPSYEASEVGAVDENDALTIQEIDSLLNF